MKHSRIRFLFRVKARQQRIVMRFEFCEMPV
jgi:hypothetical protein